MSQEGGQNYTPIPLTTGSIFHAETQPIYATLVEVEVEVEGESDMRLIWSRPNRD